MVKNIRTGFNVLLPFCLLIFLSCAGPTTRRVPVDEGLAKEEAHKQRVIALDTIVENRVRLFDLSRSVLKGSLSLCEEKRPDAGWILYSRFMFPDGFKDALKESLDVDGHLTVVHLAEGSPAQNAGLLPGDKIIRINDTEIPESKEAVGIYQKLWSELDSSAAIRLAVLRDDGEMNIDLNPETVCGYAVFLASNDDINAFADGENVVIMQGMMRFAQKDRELALVITHELAHNTMGHVDAQRKNVITGGFLGLIVDIAAAAAKVNTQGVFSDLGARAGAMRYSKEFEYEADYVGLYMMALCGFEIENAADFWRKMAAAHPGSIKSSHSSSHPATAERFVALENTVKEIKGKQEKGLPLKPELKE
jgi:beta-barrel assembly-enhancing protease